MLASRVFIKYWVSAQCIFPQNFEILIYVLIENRGEKKIQIWSDFLRHLKNMFTILISLGQSGKIQGLQNTTWTTIAPFMSRIKTHYFWESVLHERIKHNTDSEKLKALERILIRPKLYRCHYCLILKTFFGICTASISSFQHSSETIRQIFHRWNPMALVLCVRCFDSRWGFEDARKKILKSKNNFYKKMKFYMYIYKYEIKSQQTDVLKTLS